MKAPFIRAAFILLSVINDDVRSKLSAVNLARRFQSIVVDVENLRGKTGFAMSHCQVLEAMKVWRQLLTGDLTLVIDHGSEAMCLRLADYSVVFAGPHEKADDTIAEEIVPYLSACTESVLVVTADHELIQRCTKAAAPGCRFEILAPDKVASDLVKILEAMPSLQEEDEFEDGEDEPSGLVNNEELKLGADLLAIEALLSQRMPNQKRKKLRLSGSRIWNKLNDTAVIESISGFLKDGENNPRFQELSRSERKFLLSKAIVHRKKRNRRERTLDRVVLAEKLRLQLVEENDCEQS